MRTLSRPACIVYVQWLDSPKALDKECAVDQYGCPHTKIPFFGLKTQKCPRVRRGAG
jgi:hypothetical protein